MMMMYIRMSFDKKNLQAVSPYLFYSRPTDSRQEESITALAVKGCLQYSYSR